MGLTLVVVFIGVPVLVIASDIPSLFFFVSSGAIFVVSGCLLLLMFVPKLRSTEVTEFSRVTFGNDQQESASSRGSLIFQRTYSQVRTNLQRVESRNFQSRWRGSEGQGAVEDPNTGSQRVESRNSNSKVNLKNSEAPSQNQSTGSVPRISED